MKTETRTTATCTEVTCLKTRTTTRNMSKEQKISKTNCTNGCIVQNNMTAIDKEQFIVKKWHEHLVNVLEILSSTHLSPLILKVVNLAFIDKASIEICSIINLGFSLDLWRYFIIGVVTFVWTYFIIHCCIDCWFCRLGNVETDILNKKKEKRSYISKIIMY